MKWALIYLIGTTGSFETGLTFDNYLKCINTDHRALTHVMSVMVWAVGERAGPMLNGTEEDITEFLEWAKEHPEQVDDGHPRFGIAGRAKLQEFMMNPMNPGARQTPEDYKEYWGKDHPSGGVYLTPICLPTN